MGHVSVDKLSSSPVSPSSPLPLPLVLFTPDFTNPHVINKHQKITAGRALSRVDSFEVLNKGIFSPSKHEKLDKEPVSRHENAEKMVMHEEKDQENDEQCDDSMISFTSIHESVRRILGYGFEMINSKYDEVKSLVGGRTVWSAGTALLFLGAVMYIRKRDRRERQLLMLLLDEKDQVIVS